jgi:hypothetical protein
MRVLLVLLLAATTCEAQTYTQRGFLENGVTVYPEAAPNDRTRAVGESLIRYEGFYKPASAFQIAGAIDLRLDTHHQVARDLRLSWQDRELRRPLAEVRRLSAIYHRGAVTFEAGKQFVRWGKTDILTPTDRFAPRDFLTVVDNDFLPITAARLTVEKGSNTFDAVWSPWLTPSRIPLPDQRWAVALEVPTGIQLHDDGPEFPGGPQMGVRWNHIGTIEYAASVYEGFNHLPAFQASPRLTTQGIQVGIRRFYPKMLMVGGDIAVPTPWLTLKGEAAHFSSTDDRADAVVLYVLQLERQSGEWFFVGGYAGEAVTKDGTQTGDFAPDRGLTKTFLGRAGYTIDTNRSIAFETAARQNGDGTWVKFEYSQAIGQHWRATADLTVIRGEPGDFLGQYRRNSHAILVVRYSF